MDWCFGSGVNDFLIPKDQELLDWLPSPESCLRWEDIESDSLESLKNHFVSERNQYEEELNYSSKSFRNGIDMEIPTKVEEYSSGSSISGFRTEDSLHQNACSNVQPDYQLDDIAAMDRMDEIFLSSLLEEDLPSVENTHQSFQFSPDFQYSSVPGDGDMVSDFPSVSSNLYGSGSSKYFKAYSFSPSMNGEEEDSTASHSTYCKLRQNNSCPPLKAPVGKIPDPAAQNGESDEKASLEESVLQELEGVMAQLTQKTRICLRDALYRLAGRSQHQHMGTQSQSGEFTVEKFSLPVLAETSRVGTGKASESKTNAIDRAIANLMFNKMDFNARDISSASSANLKRNSITTADQWNPSSKQFPINHCQYPTITGDAEVPVYGRENPRRRMNLHEVFPCISAVDML